MFKRTGKRVLVGTGDGYGYGYGMVRQLPYEKEMTTTLNEFIYPYLCGDYDKVQQNFQTVYTCITDHLNPYRSYTAVRITLKSLDIVRKGLNVAFDNTNLEELVNSLKYELQQGCKQNMLTTVIQTSLRTTAVIDRIYFDYIMRYGPPKNGIFDSWLLSTMYDFCEQQEYQDSFPDSGKPATQLDIPLV
jgi:hypothetical protein